MNAESFLAEFGHLANAPSGVERLRTLVLQLAATGRLVVGNAKDGKAEALISKLAREKDRLIADGSIKGSNPLPPVDLSNPLPDVPTQWRWIRLGNLTSKIGSGSTPRGGSQVYVSRGVPFLRSQNVWNDGIRLDEIVFIDPEKHEGMRNTQVLPNDILLNITGASLGRCAITPSDFPTANVSQHVTIIRPLLAEIRHFIRICLLSPFGQKMIWGRQVGMAREGLSKKVLEQFEIPLPPLGEQKRIIAKVDELMALCDQLESQHQERERRFPMLSRTSHGRFAEAPTLANLNRIFDETGAVSPDDLRKTVLTLAVSGRLLPQNADDEPASVLLTHISEEKRLLVSEKKIRHQEEATPIVPQELPFDVPKGWIWARLSTITLRIQYGFTASAKREIKDVRLLRITDIQDNSVNWNSVPGCEIAEDDVAQFKLERGDILVARTGGTVGKTYLMREVPVLAVFASYLIRIQGASALIDRYLKLFLESPAYWVQLDEGARGGAQPNVNGKTLGRMVVPVPPFDEQSRIIAKVEELMTLVNQLERQQRERDKLAEALAKACVASFTGTTQLEKTEKMKAPKTELVSFVTVGKKPKPDAKAPLAQLLIQNKGTLPAKSLWQQSDLTIDTFYQQLKTEIAQGWIAPPTEAEIKIIEVT